MAAKQFMPCYDVHSNSSLFSVWLCRECQATWTIGQESQNIAGHPSHHGLSTALGHTTVPSLYVRTDGGCINNGLPGAKGGLGVYFGPGSKYNRSSPLGMSPPHTNNKAELCALLLAMEVVVSEFFVDREYLTDTLQSHPFRLVLATDSAYAVKGICEWRHGWTRHYGPDVLVKQDGTAVSNSSLFLDIEDELQRFAELGIMVEFLHIPREANKAADELAGAGARLPEA